MLCHGICYVGANVSVKLVASVFRVYDEDFRQDNSFSGEDAGGTP
jgi:hypothetical protein